MKRLLLVVTALFVLVLGGISCAPSAPPETPAPIQPAPPPPEPSPPVSPPEEITPPFTLTTLAVVVRVIDGDTIEVDIEGKLYKVRYIGIDTPETVHPTRGEEPYGKEACAKNKELVEGKIVELVKDVSETDKYGRLLRYVYVNGLFVNAELVRLGYAQVATYPPDVKYQDLFLQMQREAWEAGRGLWAATITPTAPPVEEEPTAPPSEEPAPAPAPTPVAGSDVQIIHIFYDGLVPRVESDEYVAIKNLGDAPQDLARWALRDISEGYPSFTFPHYILEPGATIRVYTNEIHHEWGGFSFSYGKAIWNNKDPDTAALYDAQGQEVSRKSY